MKQKTVKRPCPICASKTVEILHTQKFALSEKHPLAKGYDVVVCGQCGFVYADTATSQADYDNFYQNLSKYEDQATGTGGIENQWDKKRQETTAKQIAAFINNPRKFIMDIGCANGGLLSALKNLGYQVTLGIDPSENCVKNTRNIGVQAEIGSLFQLSKQKNADCVILSHTLEHIQDLKQAAQSIKNIMSRAGILYIEVPDATKYVDFVDAPFQDFNTEHINHFSMQSLHNYLNTNGFEPIDWGKKVIPASANKPYPAIFCFARLSQNGQTFEKDQGLKPKIISYISASQKIFTSIDDIIASALEKSNHLIVWGTGQLTMKLLISTSLSKANIVAFVDNNPINQGKTIDNKKVISPDQISELDEPILIATTLHQESIVKQIKQLGLSNRLILLG